MIASAVLPGRAPAVSSATSAAPVLRRKCACGGTPGPDGECEQCKRKRMGLQRSAAAAGPAVAPPVVHEVLSGPGRALDAGARGAMEARFGHSFGHVRVHDDARAADSARAVGAHAYTVGPHVVFAEGRYAPGSSEGRRLIAHELAHVVQQGGAAVPAPGALPVGAADDAHEREAERAAAAGGPVGGRSAAAVQRAFGDPPRLVPDLQLTPPQPPPFLLPGSVREAYVLPAPPVIRLQEPTLGRDETPRVRLLDTQIQGPPPMTPVMILPVPRCVPARPLTWADFPGPAQAGAFAAETRVTLPRIDVQGNPMFQVVLEPTSWVQPRYAGAGNRATNECGATIGRCQAYFDSLPAGQTGWWADGPGAACPATITSGPSVRANNRGECETVIGPACDTAAPLESARVLRHEQGHFDLFCVLVGKANDALAAGRQVGPVQRRLNQLATEQTRRYDNQTRHGCNPGQQSSWETAIAGRLPGVTIP